LTDSLTDLLTDWLTALLTAAAVGLNQLIATCHLIR
jgi:hypothetical protein